MKDTCTHTSGPWTASGQDITDSAGVLVAMIGGTGAISPDERAANARVIEATPDLLTACEAIVHAAKLNDPALWGAATTLAVAAVKKVRGKG